MTSHGNYKQFKYNLPELEPGYILTSLVEQMCNLTDNLDTENIKGKLVVTVELKEEA